MNNRLVTVVAVVLLALALGACPSGPGDGGPPDGSPPDASDGSPPDASDGSPPDASDGSPDDGGLVPNVLRETISIDLSTVVSLAVVAGPGAKTPGDPGLYALTETGEVVPVSFVEGSDGSLFMYHEPAIQRVYPTPQWIIFATWDWHAVVLDADGGPTDVPCATLAAHRDTGRLFCAPLAIQDITAGWGTTDPASNSVHPNAAGDVVYINSGNGLGQNVAYRLDLDPDSGPVGTLVPDVVGLNWVVVNATGDLLVNFKPSAYDPAVFTRVIPLDGSEPFDLGQTGLVHNQGTFAIAGEPGTADADTFYVLDGANVDGTDRRVLHVLARGEAGYTDTTHVLTLLDPTLGTEARCDFPHRLLDGVHLMCGPYTALVIRDGEVIEAPTLVLLPSLAGFLDGSGIPMRFAPGRVALFASNATERLFVRYDGITQDDIPLAPEYELQGFGISIGGDIDFLAADTVVGALVRGTIPVGSTEITILSADVIDLAATVTFTRIN
jgi:hypothetical protein